MKIVRIAQFESALVVHFGTEGSRINAYTLATTLVGLADAAKAANAVINPGYDIEIVVDALEPGSFKATIRALYTGASNLFTRDNLNSVVLGVLASVIYEHTLAPNHQVVVNVDSAEVVIEQGDTRIIVPRAVHQAARAVRDIPQFRRAIEDAARAVSSDQRIASVAFASVEVRDDAVVPIDRAVFAAIPGQVDGADDQTREIVEDAELEILRAILERSTRRWEFAWRGVKISAPVLDQSFYEDFAAHRITIAPGDALKVKLRIRQRRLPGLGVFTNELYEVVEVISHLSGGSQRDLTPTAP